MSQTRKSTNAHLLTTAGVYYELHLKFIPRVGEHIELTSYLDKEGGYPEVTHFEVAAVQYAIHDRSDASKGGEPEEQFVTILAKPSSPELFDSYRKKL